MYTSLLHERRLPYVRAQLRQGFVRSSSVLDSPPDARNLMASVALGASALVAAVDAISHWARDVVGALVDDLHSAEAVRGAAPRRGDGGRACARPLRRHGPAWALSAPELSVGEG